jgi:hypothetical protein
LLLFITTVYCGPVARTGRGRGKGGSGWYPELAAFGIGDGVSPALIREVGRQTALLPSYEIAQDELARRGLDLDIKTVHRLGRQLGAEVLTARRHELERYRNGQMPAGKELARKRIGVAIDGGRVRTRVATRTVKNRKYGTKQRRKFRTEWREPKLLILFELDKQGRMKAGTRPWIDGTFAGPDALMELLAFHLHRLGAARAKQVVFLADGAPWIWERLDWVQRRVGLQAKRCVRVLDFCHAVHHVSLLLQALGVPDAERRQQLRQYRGALRAGRCRQLVAAWAIRAGDLNKDHDPDVCRELIYLENHAYAGHMDYAVCRRRRIPLGSGAIESAMRRVVNLRLKGSGLLWKIENAEGLLVLRAAVLTDRWEETLDRAQQVLAGDRRRDWHWQPPDMRAELNTPENIAPPKPQVQAQSKAKKKAA